MTSSVKISKPGTWVYLKSEANLWTVGFFKPDGSWEPERDYHTAAYAAERVHYLNGGSMDENPSVIDSIQRALNEVIAAANKNPACMGNLLKARNLLENLLQRGGAA